MSSRKPILWTLLAALLLPLAAAAGPKVGDPFPKLSEFKLEGSLPILQGKLVIIDFWASWCGPCKRAMPVLRELHEEYADKGVVILGVNLDEEKADMDAYLKKTPMPFPMVRDPKGRLAGKLDVSGIPTSYVVGPDGRIRAIHEGFGWDATRREYVEEIEAFLKSNPPKP